MTNFSFSPLLTGLCLFAVQVCTAPAHHSCRDTFTITQTAVTGGEFLSTHRVFRDQNERIPVRWTRIPTRITVLNKTGESVPSFRMREFRSIHCSGSPHLVFNFTRETILNNNRNSIGSFQFNSHNHSTLEKAVWVTFLGEMGYVIHDSYEYRERPNHCVNVCGNVSWPAYSRTVHIRTTRGGTVSNSSINLYSDNNCQDLLRPNVTHGADLVRLTRLPNSPVTHCFTIS